jgi:hypothetical protein
VKEDAIEPGRIEAPVQDPGGKEVVVARAHGQPLGPDLDADPARQHYAEHPEVEQALGMARCVANRAQVDDAGHAAQCHRMVRRFRF